MTLSTATLEPPSTSATQGIVFMISGTLIVPVMDAIAKHLGDSLSPLQIAWGRFFFQFLIMGTAVVLVLGPAALWPARPFVHGARGLLLAIATTFFFFSLLYLPLADAIAIFFVQPMLLTLLSALFLGEKIGWHRRIAVLLGFAGALLIIKPGTEGFSIAALLPLAAAAFFSTYIAVTRSVANIDPPMTMQFASGVGATVALSMGLLLAEVASVEVFAAKMPSLPEWGWLAAIGMIASAGHLLVVMAVNRAPASLLAPFGYAEIIAATALGWWIFGDWPDLLSWIGIAVIIASGFYVFIREQHLKQPVNTLH